MHLQDKVALVTGAAHRVGRAVAMGLGAEGARLVLHYGTSADEAEETATVLRREGTDVLLVRADLASPAEIAALFEAVKANFGRLDVLVNSAAIFKRQPFDTITADDWDRVMAVNLRAPFLATQYAARLMRAGQGGSIINIADLSGVHPWIDFAHHATSKAALIHLTKVAARELAPTVRVNAIIPGALLPPPGVEASSPAWAAIGDRVPLKRTGSPSDAAEAVLYLAQNDFITGAVLTIDGGEGLLGPIGH